MNQIGDKRISPRLDVCVAANFKQDGEIINTVVRNLSDSGVYMTADQEYEKGTVTECELNLGQQKINFKGEIVRSLIGDDHFGYGVQIVDIENKFREDLDEFLKESWILFNNIDNAQPVDKMLLENSQYELIHNVDVLNSISDEITRVEYSEFNGLESRIASANFPFKASLDNFNFINQSGATKKEIETIIKFDWIKEKKNVLVFGPTGSGKTHIAISVATKAIENGYRVNFVTMVDLINAIKNAGMSVDNKFNLAKIMDSDVILVDEIGTTALNVIDSSIFENFINKVSGNISVLFTSNITLEQFKDVVNNDDIVNKISNNMKHIVFLKGVVH